MSSAATVCRGLQSCLEPLLLEPLVVMHQISPSKQGSSSPLPRKEPDNPKGSTVDGQDSNASCWGFLQSSTKTSHSFSQDNEGPVYVHPLDKRRPSLSLEMCTESLGSETGSSIDSTADEFYYYDTSEKQSSCSLKQPKARGFVKKIKHTTNFPPPLTSISGNECVQVETHREGGRLVIKAFSFQSYFQAERRNGRLRISMVRDGFRDSDHELAENADDVEDGEENGNEPEKDSDGDGEAEYNASLWGESWSISRCNGDRGGSKRLQSLPFCVAIS